MASAMERAALDFGSSGIIGIILDSRAVEELPLLLAVAKMAVVEVRFLAVVKAGLVRAEIARGINIVLMVEGICGLV